MLIPFLGYYSLLFWAILLTIRRYILPLQVDSEDEGKMSLRNIGSIAHNHT
jgi:hypothetical protein